MSAITRIGLFGMGLDAYWPHFPRLKERLEDYLAMVRSKLAREGWELSIPDWKPYPFADSYETFTHR